MMIENVFGIAKRLQDLGFGDLSGKIAKQICFQRENFIVVHTVEYDEMKIGFRITIRKGASEQYVIGFFDAIIGTPLYPSNVTINGVDAADLDARMSLLDWRKAFDVTSAAPLDPTDRSTWANEEKIGAIVKELTALEASAEGKLLAAHLKGKHWFNDASNHERFTPRQKPEISQRFYFTDGHGTITVDEACRFLKNCQVEKQVNEQKKRQPSGGHDSRLVGNGSGPLKKSRSSKSIKNKGHQTEHK